MDNTLIIDRFATGIEEAMDALGTPWPVKVIAAKEATTQGPETECIAVYFHEIHTRRYGWPQKKEEWNPLLQVFEQVQSQQNETTYQFNVVYLVTEPYGTTAHELARMVADCMASDMFLDNMRVEDISILRITDVRNPSFQNDQGVWEQSPSFDATITYRDERRFTVPALTSTDAKIYRV